MKTSEEVFMEHVPKMLYDIPIIDASNKKVIFAAMRRYAELACREQREICYNNAETDYSPGGDCWASVETINKESIVNAPLPELK